MLIPIHVAFLDLLNGKYQLTFGDLIQQNGHQEEFINRIIEGKQTLDNLSLVLGIKKRDLMKRLKLGMQHPDIPNDTRGLIKRVKTTNDGNHQEQIDVIGLKYDVLNMYRFYQLEKLSSQIDSLHDQDLFDQLLELYQSEDELVRINPLEGWERKGDPLDDEISNLADYFGELTENHYGSQSIGHSMPSEKNLNMLTATKKILKRATLLYFLALNDRHNVRLPQGGPEPFWIGVIMHAITDSYSTVHTYRAHYHQESDQFYELGTKWQDQRLVDPKFQKFTPRLGQLFFSKWELKSPLSLFSRCLSNYLDTHLEAALDTMATFNYPEEAYDYLISSVCDNYCSRTPESNRIFCFTCQASLACRAFRALNLTQDSSSDHSDRSDEGSQSLGPKWEEFYLSGSLTGLHFNLAKFGEFVVSEHLTNPEAQKIRKKVIELINRLLFFKLREQELTQLISHPALSDRFDIMIENSFHPTNNILKNDLPVTPPVEKEDLDPDSGLRSSLVQQGGASQSLWRAFTSTIQDLLSRGESRITRAPTLEAFSYYEKEQLHQQASRRREHQSFIIDYHDYEKQTEPPDTHMKCDYVQDPCLLEEIHDNLVHLTQLYSFHLNYLYKIKIKKGENVQKTFLQEKQGNLRALGDPEYSVEEYRGRLRKCLKEFYHYLYYWVYRLPNQRAAESRIKRFTVNPDTCRGT